VFKMEFLLDFDNVNQPYDCKFDLSDVEQITIGDNGSSNIILNSPYVQGDKLRLTRKDTGWNLTEEKSLYGIYINGIKLQTKSCILKDYDFFSIANYHFFYKNNTLYTSVDGAMIIKGIQYFQEEKEGILKYPLFNRNTRIKTVIPA